jgi:mRNA-degrading endonuclease YafQ of YafQ-DinJ toxin-antitoxin module
MYQLRATTHFDRQLARFERTHPELKQRVGQILLDLEADPHQPHLRLHALHGTLAGKHAMRITQKYRKTLTLQITEREIILLDIGDHGQVYR